ncbi:MAG: hypothetical protein ACLPIX_06040 [Rhodomicrobium sp.]
MDKEDEEPDSLRRLWQRRPNASLERNPRADLIEDIAQQFIEGKRNLDSGLTEEERRRARISLDSPANGAAEERSILEAADRRAREKTLADAERRDRSEDKAEPHTRVTPSHPGTEAEAVRRAQQDTLEGRDQTISERAPKSHEAQPQQDHVAAPERQKEPSERRSPEPARNAPTEHTAPNMASREPAVPEPVREIRAAAEIQDAPFNRERPIIGERSPNFYQPLKEQHRELLQDAQFEGKSLFAELGATTDNVRRKELADRSTGREDAAPSRDDRSAAEAADQEKTPSLFDLAGAKQRDGRAQPDHPSTPFKAAWEKVRDESGPQAHMQDQQQTGPELAGQLGAPAPSRSAREQAAAQHKDNPGVMTNRDHERASPLREAFTKISEVKVEITGRGRDATRDHGRDM